MENGKRYKLIAFDIDGTILDAENKVCKKLIEIVLYLQNKGYKFTLASARIPQSVIQVAKELNISNHVISLNGSFITDYTNNSIYSKTFPIASILDIIKKLSPKISRNYYHEYDWIVENKSKFSEVETSFFKDLCIPTNNLNHSHVNKICLNGKYEILLKAKQFILKNTNLLVEFSHENYLEISNNISKLDGLKHYAKHLNITIDEIIAFGDGENDIAMLSGVGFGVAMENAKKHIKEKAKDIAEHHKNQGVAKYLEKLINNNTL